MFIDEASIYAKGGGGGNGCMSFRREKFVPFGGPDGGDGGRGGDVILESTKALQTLLDFRYMRHFKGERGEHGRGKNMSGREGEGLKIPVPVGTVVYDKKSGKLIADMARAGERVLVAAGGRGGRGNAHFANAANKAPKFAEKGEPGEDREIRLELKLLADVGIIGFPNAGKSTLLSRISAAKPKIADYPFTTLSPILGVVSHHDQQAVFADIPGLIEGAHEGAGLGIKFLKHIERTRLLIHLIDLNEVDLAHPFKQVKLIEHELSAYSPKLSTLPQIYVGNKIDLPDVREKAQTLVAAFQNENKRLSLISGYTGEGIPEMLNGVFENLKNAKPSEETLIPDSTFEIPIEVRREDDHFVVTGKDVERAVAMTDLENDEAVRHLQKTLSRYKIETRLERLGILEGDTVKIGAFEFSYTKSAKRPKLPHSP